MAITAYHFMPTGEIRSIADTDGIKKTLDSQQGLLWVDIDNISTSDSEILLNVFKFHHLAVEDCLSDSVHIPKIDDFTSHLFIIVNDIIINEKEDTIKTAQLTIFLGTHFVVTTHPVSIHCINQIRTLLIEERKPFKQEAVYLVHAIIDMLIDNILPVINVLDNKTADLEDIAILNPKPTTLQNILQLKHSALSIHRIMISQRDVLSHLSRGEFSIINQDALIFYRDIYDHIIQIEDLLLTLRDNFDNALNLYMSSIANRQNETMRILSIVATIFMPLTLIVGIYGMNFEYMPELTWHWGYFATLGLMGVCIIIILLWCRSQGWINWGHKKKL